MNCAKCKTRACHRGEVEKMPKNCPSQVKGVKEEFFELYKENKELENLALNAARTESCGYKVWSRLEEIIEFSKKAGFNKLGIAFCVGLHNEASKTTKILEDNGFEVVSAMCKLGSIPKEDIGLEDKEKINPGNYEPICHPIGQAKILNQEETDFNIILGLCVGHDSLLIKHLEAPVTNFAVKDRALGHNPLVAVYCDFYMSSRFEPKNYS